MKHVRDAHKRPTLEDKRRSIRNRDEVSTEKKSRTGGKIGKCLLGGGRDDVIPHGESIHFLAGDEGHVRGQARGGE